MNARNVTMFLRLLQPLKRWKRGIFPARNVAVKILKDYSTGLVFVIRAEAAVVRQANIPHQHEAG